MEKQRIVPGKTSDNFSQLFKAREQYYIVLSLLEYSVSLVVSYDTWLSQPNCGMQKQIPVASKTTSKYLTQKILRKECIIIHEKKKVLPYITMLSSFIPPPAMNEAHSVERRKDLQDSYSKSDTINSVYNFNNVAVRTEYIQDKWSYFITHLVGEEALDIRHFCFHNPNHLAVQEVLHCLQPLSLPFSTGSIHNVSLIYPLFHYLAFWKIYTNRKRKK